MEFLSWNLAYVSELFEADGEDRIRWPRHDRLKCIQLSNLYNRFTVSEAMTDVLVLQVWLLIRI